jgi:hypothetical protein
MTIIALYPGEAVESDLHHSRAVGGGDVLPATAHVRITSTGVHLVSIPVDASNVDLAERLAQELLKAVEFIRAQEQDSVDHQPPSRNSW